MPCCHLGRARGCRCTWLRTVSPPRRRRLPMASAAQRLWLPSHRRQRECSQWRRSRLPRGCSSASCCTRAVPFCTPGRLWCWRTVGAENVGKQREDELLSRGHARAHHRPRFLLRGVPWVWHDVPFGQQVYLEQDTPSGNGQHPHAPVDGSHAIGAQDCVAAGHAVLA